MADVTVGPAFKDELDRLCNKWGPQGRQGEFTMDLMGLVVSAIQAGRGAAQGVDGFVMCGRCNKVVHKCDKSRI